MKKEIEIKSLKKIYHMIFFNGMNKWCEHDRRKKRNVTFFQNKMIILTLDLLHVQYMDWDFNIIASNVTTFLKIILGY